MEDWRPSGFAAVHGALRRHVQFQSRQAKRSAKPKASITSRIDVHDGLVFAPQPENRLNLHMSA